MFILSKFPSFFQGEMSLRETGFQMYRISFVVENQVQGEWKEGGKGTATTWDTHTALRQCHRTRNANFKRLWHLCRGTACSPWWCLTAHRILKHPESRAGRKPVPHPSAAARPSGVRSRGKEGDQRRPCQPEGPVRTGPRLGRSKHTVIGTSSPRHEVCTTK